jgi:hypothetical protein
MGSQLDWWLVPLDGMRQTDAIIIIIICLALPPVLEYLSKDYNPLDEAVPPRGAWQNGDRNSRTLR